MTSLFVIYMQQIFAKSKKDVSNFVVYLGSFTISKYMLQSQWSISDAISSSNFSCLSSLGSISPRSIGHLYLIAIIVWGCIIQRYYISRNMNSRKLKNTFLKSLETNFSMYFEKGFSDQMNFTLKHLFFQLKSLDHLKYIYSTGLYRWNIPQI